MTRPGIRLRALAKRLCNASAMERLIDPAIADLQHEYDDAVRHGTVWRRHWVRLAGYAAFAKVAAACAAWHALREQTATIEAGVTRTVGFSLIAVGAFTALLIYEPLSGFRDSAPADTVSMTRLVVFLLPQALTIALPFGLLFGILLALRDRLATARVAWTIGLIGAASSVAAFVLTAWLLPAANQAFRELIFGGPLPPGNNELTLAQLARSNSPTLLPVLRWRLAYEFHMRVALAFAPFVLSLFAIAVSSVRHRVYGRLTVGLAASLWAIGYYTVMVTAREAVYHADWAPPVSAAWAANAVIAIMTLLVFWRVRREAAESHGDGRNRHADPTLG